MRGRTPPIHWIEIEHQAHILNGEWQTYCGKRLDQSNLIMLRSMDGCMDCLTRFTEVHHQPPPIFEPDNDPAWDEPDEECE